jgi:hypothetical protein
MRVCIYNQLYFTKLQWYFSFVLLDLLVLFVLLVSIACFLLVSISFSFIAILTTMALKPRLVVFVNNINEGSRDVAFVGKVLCRYGNWNPNKEHKFLCLHCDLIDKAGFTTIIISVRNSQIEQHEEKLHVRFFVQIENLGISNKSEKSFEKGDMLVVLKVQSTTSVIVIEDSGNECISKFFHSDSISKFENSPMNNRQ